MNRPEGEGRGGTGGGGAHYRRIARLGWLLALFALLLWGPELARQWLGDEAPRIPYTGFRDQVAAGNVESVTLRGERVEGQLREAVLLPVEAGRRDTVRHFRTVIPATGDPQLLAVLRESGVRVMTLPEGDSSPWSWILVGLLPLLLLAGLGWLMMRRMQARAGGLFGIRRSPARRYRADERRTTFDDVAGLEGPKEELREVVGFLRDPERFGRLGGRVPKGVLLVGPPGTGKTLLARAVAGEAGVSFFSITGSDFMEMLVGVGASRVRDLFGRARKEAPSIIFIDELDSIGRRRGTGLGGGHDEREQTLNQLLSELDGFQPSESVVVMAATNRPDILDPALLRPGRFDRRVQVDLPTVRERLAILRLHARERPLDPEVDLERLARATPGLSGADLENLLNEAALAAARSGHERVLPPDVEEARDRVLIGRKRTGLSLSEQERRTLAYHEAGHAVVAAFAPHADPVHKVTLIPRERAMGATQQLPEEERVLRRREELLDRLAVLLGGRAAEEVALETATSGAEDDLRRATELARRMVTRWGMGEGVGPPVSAEGGPVFLGEEMGRMRRHSEATARRIDEEVREILEEAYRRARETLGEHREGLDRVAERLLAEEEITGEDVAELAGVEH